MKNTINSTNKHDLNRMSKKDRKWVFTWAFRFFLSRTNIMHKSFRTKSPVLFGANVNSQKIHAANKPPAKSIWIFPAFCEFLSRSCVAQLMQLHPSFFCWEAVKKSCKLFFSAIRPFFPCDDHNNWRLSISIYFLWSFCVTTRHAQHFNQSKHWPEARQKIYKILGARSVNITSNVTHMHRFICVKNTNGSKICQIGSTFERA